jgi:site-specific recombinase XerD
MLRPCDLDLTADVWSYRPASHKTQHRGRERIIFIGPKAQDVLRPYLLRDKSAYCFAPADSERKRLAALHELRVTPLCCGNRPGTNRKRKPAKKAGGQYTTHSYRRAITRAIELVNAKRREDAADDETPDLLSSWAPNQLRHAAATDLRRRYGLEAARTVLGHADPTVTSVYAEADLVKAASVMREVG